MKTIVLRLAIIVVLLASLPFYAHSHELSVAADQTAACENLIPSTDELEAAENGGHSDDHGGIEPPLHCGASILLTEIGPLALPQSSAGVFVRVGAPTASVAANPDPPPPRD